MKAIAKTSRVNPALQVIQHMNNGMTVIAACKEVGIPRSTDVDPKTWTKEQPCLGGAQLQCP
jgi:hypothetical protein